MFKHPLGSIQSLDTKSIDTKMEHPPMFVPKETVIDNFERQNHINHQAMKNAKNVGFLLEASLKAIPPPAKKPATEKITPGGVGLDNSTAGTMTVRVLVSR